MADQKKQEKKDISGIASMEAMLEKYIDNNITPIFEKNVKELESNKKKEYVELSKKYLSIPLNAQSLDQMKGHNVQIEMIIHEKGVWQKKGFDWIVEKTIEDLSNPRNISKGEDLGGIVGLLQDNIIKNIGKKKYDELCKKYDVDIAEAKFKMILSERMEAYMIKRNMPKSDIEYVLKNILNETFIGASIQTAAPQKNDKDLEVDEKALKQYDASLLAKGTSTVLSYAIDGVTFGQSGFVKAIVTGIGWNLGVSGVDKTVEWGINKFKGKSRVLTPEESYDLNKDIYGANVSNSDIDAAKNSSLSVKLQKVTNLRLNNKIRQKYSPSEADVFSKRFLQAEDPAEILKVLKQSGIKVSSRDVAQHIKDKDMKENYRLACYFMGQLTEMKMSGAKTIKIGETTLTEKQVAQRARDYAYYANEQFKIARANELDEQRKNEIDDVEIGPDGEVRLVSYARDSKKGQELAGANNPQAMVNEQMQNGFGGWQSMLGWGGGEFLSSTKNLSEIITSLPDMLVGMFTGRNKHLKLSECFFPIAAIMGAMFFRNPILKLLMFLAGFMILAQKANKKIEDENSQSASRSYRRVPDEPLNPRIKNPVMKGNTLVASIDDRPYVITVSDQAVDAYYKGYVPINALSNKVLEVFDRQEGELQNAYSQNVANTEEQQRTRGIK